MSVRDCIELERSNLSLHIANSDKNILKVVSEELQLKARLEKKIIKSTKKRKTRQLERESFTREIPDRNWKTERGKEMAVIKSRRTKTRDRKPYLCCPGTGS